MNNNNNKPQLDIEINRSDLDQIFARTFSSSSNKLPWDKETLHNLVNSNLAKAREDGKSFHDRVHDHVDTFTKWRLATDPENRRLDAVWEKVKKEAIVTIENKKDFTNSNVLDYTEFLRYNKGTIFSGLQMKKTLVQTAENKPLGIAGDITINELITKGFEIVDTPLVQMIKEKVDISVVGGYITSMILYKSIVNLYVKSAYNSSISEVLLSAPSTRSREVALFMLAGAPFVAGCMWVGSKIFGGKVVVNINNNELDGGSSISSSSFFLFFHKLPRWLKAILRYLAYYLIGSFIVQVIGYNSTVLQEISAQSNLYIGYFLKFFCILNFLVVIYFLWKLYVIVMYANDKGYLNPDDYPNFIKTELTESKDIAIKVFLRDPWIVYKHYLKLIFLYSAIVFFGLIVIGLHSIYLTP